MALMSVSNTVRLLAASLSLGTVVGWGPTANAADERPNIVLIVADDVGYADMGMFGGEIGVSPARRRDTDRRFLEC